MRFWRALALITVVSITLWFGASIRPTGPPTIARSAVVVADSPYVQDLLCASLCKGQRSSSNSPDGRYAARTLPRCSGAIGVLARLLQQRSCLLRDVQVVAADGSAAFIVTLGDAEPGSGSAHDLSWSQDSQALLISGKAGLPDALDRPVDLCLVYRPTTGELQQLRECPRPAGNAPRVERQCRRDRPCVPELGIIPPGTSEAP